MMRLCAGPSFPGKKTEMKIYNAIAAVFTAATSVFCMVLALHRDHRQNQYTTRAALYDSMRAGEILQPQEIMKELASQEVIELWSTFIFTGLKADMERLLRQVREETRELAKQRRKKNWAKFVSILMIALTAAILLVSAGNAAAHFLPDSGFARRCHALHFCFFGSRDSQRSGGRSREAIAPAATSPPQAPTPPVGQPTTRPAEGQSHQGRPPIGTPTRKPVPTPTATTTPQATAPDCGTFTGEVPCVVGKVRQVTGQCVMGLLKNPVNAGALSPNLSSLGSETQCIMTGLLSSPSDMATPGASVSPSPPPSTQPNDVVPLPLP